VEYVGRSWRVFVVWGGGVERSWRVFYFCVVIWFVMCWLSWEMVCGLLDVGEGLSAVIGDGDHLVIHVKPIVCGSYISPQKLGVKGFSVDEGGEEVEVVFSGMKPDENCSVDHS
jgi:hypothetical protein